ncbi:MAG: NAD(P)H-quinone oxidoreductase [Acidobacteria bacterium]|nr:NAD(P)H-quinone oxidoreductase [Acidobacteriota bacterium]
MRAVAIAEPGPPDVLRPVTRPTPRPGSGEVLVRVAAAGINRADVMQREGRYPPPPGASDLPGLELSGTVAAVGPEADGVADGDEVCAIVSGGAYAEYCLVPAPQCLPIPEGVSVSDAAALPEAYCTVWTNVVDRGRLQAGESFLVHGGSSGVGTAAIQLARRLGARVFATAGSAAKCSVCVQLGAERAVNYREEDFVAAVRDGTGGRGVDVVLDMVGAPYLARNLAALAVEGRLVVIAVMAGAEAEVNLLDFMSRRLTLTASTLRSRSVAQKAEVGRAVREHVWPRFAAGELRPVIHATWPLAEAAEAHRVLESSAHVGKLLLVP